MWSPVQSLRFICWQVLTLLLATLIFLTFPILLVFSLPLYLFRYFVSKIGKYVDPGLGRILQPQSAIQIIDDFYENPKFNVLIKIQLEGILDLSQARDIFKAQVLQAKFPSSGAFIYPEFQQYLTTWAGYSFWKNDPTFKLENHFKLIHLKGGGLDEREEITGELLNKKWERNKPLWQILILHNYFPKEEVDEEGNKKGESSVMFIRFHHCLSDMHSWERIFSNRLCTVKSEHNLKDVPLKNPKKRICSQIVFTLGVPFAMAYLSAVYATNAFSSEIPWKVPHKEQNSGRILIERTKGMSMSIIHEIKGHFRVSFHSVILAIVAGAQRELLSQKEIPIPYEMPFFSAMRVGGGRDERLGNYITSGIFDLPVGESDPVKRLGRCSKVYERVKCSYSPLMMRYGAVISGSHFARLIKLGSSGNQSFTSGISSFPFGQNHLYFAGNKIIDFSFGSQISGAFGVVFFALSYVDGLNISPVGHSAVITKKELRELSNLIEKQLHILYEHVQ